jgi:hypothetical protein
LNGKNIRNYSTGIDKNSNNTLKRAKIILFDPIGGITVKITVHLGGSIRPSILQSELYGQPGIASLECSTQ